LGPTKALSTNKKKKRIYDLEDFGKFRGKRDGENGGLHLFSREYGGEEKRGYGLRKEKSGNATLNFDRKKE